MPAEVPLQCRLAHRLAPSIARARRLSSPCARQACSGCLGVLLTNGYNKLETVWIFNGLFSLQNRRMWNDPIKNRGSVNGINPLSGKSTDDSMRNGRMLHGSVRGTKHAVKVPLIFSGLGVFLVVPGDAFRRDSVEIYFSGTVRNKGHLRNETVM